MLGTGLCGPPLRHPKCGENVLRANLRGVAGAAEEAHASRETVRASADAW